MAATSLITTVGGSLKPIMAEAAEETIIQSSNSLDSAISADGSTELREIENGTIIINHDENTKSTMEYFDSSKNLGVVTYNNRDKKEYKKDDQGNVYMGGKLVAEVSDSIAPISEQSFNTRTVNV